ncbi:LCP family protein [Actinospica robiniae]|uniref:LCP family protein n=1 Tax=Actinospica robiniae TaxID=304901 RepID=UPI0004295E69|nr:LCP family protein [Actinospica robiniae]
MSGTGRRRKPPVEGEGGGEPQYERGAFEAQEPQGGQQWQTYAPAPEPQYDYDWRGAESAAQPPAAPAAPAAPPPAAAEQWPPQYQQPYQEYQIPQPRWEQPAPAAYVEPDPIPAPPPAAQPEPAPAASAAPAPRTRPQPRPEPAGDAFNFDFDLDEDDASAASATGPRPAAGRPADKDGYRPGDFAFVDEGNDPEVKGWLEFSESRADSRAERTRRLRTRLTALAAVLVLAGAGFGAYSVFGGSSSTPAAAAATKSLLLFQLDDADGNSIGDALMVTKRGGAQDGSAVGGTGAIVVIPAKMQIQSDFGTQPFGGDMTGSPLQPPADDTEVAATLGVTPDGDMTMNETTFGIFVDELGGLTVTTNTDIPATTADPSGVKQGTVTLSGAQAVAYATYQAKGESDSAQSVRFGQVVSALMTKMPSFGNAVSAQLNQLGLITKPSMPLTKLSPILAALAAQQAAGKVTEVVLPLSQDGNDTLNYTAAAPIVSKLLGGTMKAGASAGQAARVLVEDATGATGPKAQQLISAAEADLQNGGYTFNGGDAVPEQAKTVVEVASSSQQGLAQQVASGLGLSGSTVKVVPGLAQVDDVTVVLGADWASVATAGS